MENNSTNFLIKPLILKLSVGILFLILFFLIHVSLQNKTIYNATLGKVSQQYEKNEEGSIVLAEKPYEKIENEKLTGWDGIHYLNIRNHLYDVSKIGVEQIFAFFPLFPIIWKATALSSIGICVLNFLFFIIAVIIIGFYLSETPNSKSGFFQFLTAISLPTTVVFLMPYTEAVFILTFSIAIIGLFKRKYWLFFLGLFLFAMVRSAVVIIALSLLVVEIIYLFRHRNLFTFFKRLFSPALPLFLGTFAVSLLQLAYGSGSLLKFMEVHKHWDHTFKIPQVLSDWSFEGFGLNIASLFMITIPCIVFLFVFFISTLKKKTQKAETLFSPSASNESIKEYLFLLSSVYVVGISLFIVFYQGGNITGSFRYILCSPFFYILFFYMADKLKKIRLIYKLVCFGIVFLTALYVFSYTSYSVVWTFSDTGFFLLTLSIALVLFKDHTPVKLYTPILIILVFSNIIWNTYLFNCYLNDAWIFT